MPITLEIFFLLYSSIKRFYESPFKVWAFKLHMASTISAKWLFVILAESLMYESMQLEYLLEPTIFFFFQLVRSELDCDPEAWLNSMPSEQTRAS